MKLNNLTLNLAYAENDLRDAVALINSWEDPYTELYKRGVTGTQKRVCRCPIAVFLTAESHVEDLAVGANTVVSWIGFERVGTFVLSDQVEQFINDFDKDRYPELVAR